MTAPDLSCMDAALPRRLFAQEAEKDIGRLAQLARVLLCLDPDTLRDAVTSAPRLHQALYGLLHLPQWRDLLQRNPGLIVQALPLLRLYRRLDGPQPQVFAPLEALLRERYFDQSEWMPLYLLEAVLALHELGYPAPCSVEAARQQTLLDLSVPGWVWCFEKSSVLDFLMLVVGGAGWTLPEAWQETCTADLAFALREGDGLAVGRAAFHHRLGGGPPELLEQAWTATPRVPPKAWDEALGHAYLAVSASQLRRQEAAPAPLSLPLKESAMFAPFDWNALRTWTATALNQLGCPEDLVELRRLAELCEGGGWAEPQLWSGSTAAPVPLTEWLMLPDSALHLQVQQALTAAPTDADPAEAWVLPACAMVACREYQLALAADLLRLMIRRRLTSPVVTEIAEFLAFQQRPSGECGYLNPLHPAPFAPEERFSRFTLPATAAIADALRAYEQERTHVAAD
ncbi:hypothetical protein [Deinococcus aquatilis]|uniref:hypothetical protein n=1 Tax=Deinococcus aquatilis TaxID=519440 RepID=UPI00039B2882|nr:hypothetical protein [Deinococcus aquatilis]